MAETEPNAAGQPERTKRERLRLEEFAFPALVALSIIGESITNYSPIISFWYWLTMIPVFAMIAIITEWSQARARSISATNVIVIQLVHWGGTCIGLFATYSLWHVGRLANEHTGLVILLLLALTTFLDGYHVGWRFYLAGLLLFAYAIIAALLKVVIWVALLIAVPVVIFGLYWNKRHPLPTAAKSLGKQ
jgi:hypothetical protein